MEEATVTAHPRVRVFIATSLDGFISREDGSIDWLDEANRLIPGGEDCGYGTFFAETDVLVLGRKTFESVLKFPEWPFGQKPVVVVTGRPGELAIPEALSATVTASAEKPRDLVVRLSALGARRLYIDGGALIRSFIAEDLVDEITLTLIPVLLGSGRPLFGGNPSDLSLRLEGVTRFDFGFVQLRYARSRSEA